MILAAALGGACGDGGTGGSGGGGGDACGGQAINAVFDTGDASKHLMATCITFAGVGQPLLSHIAEIRFDDGTILELTFPASQAAPADLNLTGGEARADVMNYLGFEGGSQTLCDGVRGDTAEAGTFSLASLKTGADGFLDELHGTVDASFTGCTVASLGLNKATLTLKGSF